ncbi:MAG: DUF1349 domain-containing protein [Pseudomonadota bacterium]
MACLLAATVVGAGATAPLETLRIDGLPFVLEQRTERGKLTSDKTGLTLSASKGTDLYVNADGSKRADATPRLLFAPVGDFIFSARVSAAFNAPFDGAALIVYADGVNWAKLLFEHGRNGKQGVSSTVVKGVGDDAHHGGREGGSVYLKLARRESLYVFYTSPDGKVWQMVRNFSLPATQTVKVGFSSQSPLGEQFTAQFSHIHFRAAAFKDFWQGE